MVQKFTIKILTIFLKIILQYLISLFQPDYYIDAPHFRRIGDGPQYCLEIPCAKLDYTGTYSVIAKNCHGEAKAIISLQIIAKGKLIGLKIQSEYLKK